MLGIRAKTLILTLIIAITFVLAFSAQNASADPGDIIVPTFNSPRGVVQVSIADGSQTIVTEPGVTVSLIAPAGVAVDSNGDYIVGDHSSTGLIVKVDPAGDGGIRGSAQTVITSGGFLRQTTALEIDSNGDYIVVSATSKKLVKVSAVDGTQPLLAEDDSLLQAFGLAIDANVDYIVTIIHIKWRNGCPVIFITLHITPLDKTQFCNG